MRLRHRPATAYDLGTYVKYLTVSDRYGKRFARLSNVWNELLRRELIISSVVEDLDREQEDRLVGFALCTFLTDWFTRHAKTPPLFWIGPELIRRMDENESPILDYFGIRAANSGDGLNLFVWEADARATTELGFLAVVTELGKAFVECHSGFNVKQVIGQQPRSLIQAAVRGGSWFVHHQTGEYVAPYDSAAVGWARSPFILGLSRELAHKLPGSLLSPLFCRACPRVFFTRAEQRLLNVALSGGTDREIADALEVSLPGVKRCWESVYARVSSQLPGLLPQDCLGLSLTRGRGMEKRRRLLSYLRDHPEELRPILPNAAIGPARRVRTAGGNAQ